ncbi:Z1 domain-containing protein [Streptacidiphilus sp. ASG 303]|uniref:Z1 domain-containing protein n=1 Tax=Streptacidiphilus sp. ASG 303 TaxID=2896847 RepID=UPI001E594E8B|nr:Z1 domain-containing protein [Streptacidiphilus sp. ASG 303]MCD0486166.1 Z1 domain-containing protein [Streptacidiphilus sp. ASG 303]
MSDPLLAIHSSVLAMMRESGPRSLTKYLFVVGDDIDPDADVSEAALLARLGADAEGGGALAALWRQALKQWDHEEAQRWTTAEPNTLERRTAVYDLLGLGAALRECLSGLAPVAVAPGPVVIAREHRPWYGDDAAARREWYWPAYEKVLHAKGWSADAVASLDQASTRVVERLADPASPEAYQARGLVVGYVQSGKTANFTGVIAKAMDAGYRLVIVLGGTLNLLRAQTQRRLDMELVGRENVLRGADPDDPQAMEGVDYRWDPDWLAGRFVSHGGRPSELGAFDVERLTTRDDDYRSLLQGITALEFEKREPGLPLHDPRNLHRTAARLMVVKKNKAVLTKLVKDLKKIRTPLAEIPVLIVDDESDQASVNTSDPKKTAERTAINGLISQLIRLLPRAQYVGYTATPFANVFIDPSDAEDIFPRDFLVSLPRPEGYMGVQDFHDLDSDVPPEERTVANSAEKAHVRDIAVDESAFDGPEDADAYADAVHLRQALDMYVLTAAVKVYREELGTAPYRHHTMLVHESVRTADHRDLADRLRTLWHGSDYYGRSGHDRLRHLFETDLLPVSSHHADGMPVPASYEELQRHVGAAVHRIGGSGHPVLVVNGDKDLDQPELDFDGQPVWKVLVGGAKLSRGFTVEGLTVTYYRRTTGAADTLMQMGRWFGFRRGYRDLVRLYIGRTEQLTRTKTVDLYEAFEAVCRDEESFRAQLAQYAAPVDGRPQLTPAQVPPLVAQHLPWVKPSARNKMFNAELVEIRSPGQWIEPTAYPEKAADLRRNAEVWQPVLAALAGERDFFTHLHKEDRGRYTDYPAQTAVLPHPALVEVLEGLTWPRPELFAPHLQYLRDMGALSHGADDWVVIAPQTSGPGSVPASILGAAPLTLVVRGRSARGVFNRISGVAHRQSAERIAGLLPPTDEDPSAGRLARPRRGAVLLYPVVDRSHGSLEEAAVNGTADPGKIVIAFAVLPPAGQGAASGPLVRFRAVNSDLASEPIVSSSAG